MPGSEPGGEEHCGGFDQGWLAMPGSEPGGEDEAAPRGFSEGWRKFGS